VWTPYLDFQYFLQNASELTEATGQLSEEIEVTVYPVWYKSMTLSWTIPDAWASRTPRFNVYRSRTQGGEFELVSPEALPLVDQFFVDAESFLESSKFSEYQYFVQVILDDGSVLKVSPLASATPFMGDWQKIRKNEINRRESILLRKFTGVDSILLRRKASGLRCPTCWDEASRTCVKNNCPDCFGVSFLGGYHKGLRLLVQYDTNMENKIYSFFGKMESNQIGGWTIAFPDIEATDLLVRLSDHSIYRVAQIQNTQLQGENVRQVLQLTQLAKQGVEYKLIERELS
jgi:hypothetical protein